MTRKRSKRVRAQQVEPLFRCSAPTGMYAPAIFGTFVTALRKLKLYIPIDSDYNAVRALKKGAIHTDQSGDKWERI
jgi:hypothetical protein